MSFLAPADDDRYNFLRFILEDDEASAAQRHSRMTEFLVKPGRFCWRSEGQAGRRRNQPAKRTHQPQIRICKPRLRKNPLWRQPILNLIERYPLPRRHKSEGRTDTIHHSLRTKPLHTRTPKHQHIQRQRRTHRHRQLGRHNSRRQSHQNLHPHNWTQTHHRPRRRRRRHNTQNLFRKLLLGRSRTRMPQPPKQTSQNHRQTLRHLQLQRTQTRQRRSNPVLCSQPRRPHRNHRQLPQNYHRPRKRAQRHSTTLKRKPSRHNPRKKTRNHHRRRTPSHLPSPIRLQQPVKASGLAGLG